jgi:hypothetical protein
VVIDAKGRHARPNVVAGRRRIRVDEKDAVLRVGDPGDRRGSATGCAGADDEDLAVGMPAVEPRWVLRPGLEPSPSGKARDHQAVLERDRGRGQHRLGGAAREADLDEGVGLLGSGGDHPPRPIVVDAQTDAIDAAREQSRGDRVAGEARQGLAVELEGDRRRSIDVRPAARPT